MSPSRTVSIIFYNQKVYIPSTGIYPSEIFADIDPVYVVNATVDALVPIVIEQLSRDPEPVYSLLEQREKSKQLLPKITGARSWKKLAAKGQLYSISLSNEVFTLSITKLDDKGRWIFDAEKEKRFPGNIDIREIVEFIVDNYAKHQKN